MDKNKFMPIERLLTLKTGKREPILGVNLKINDGITVEVSVNEDIKMLVAPFFNDLVDLIMKSISFADSKKMEEEKSKLSSEDGACFAYIYYKFKEDGRLSIMSHFNLISSDIVKTKKGKEMFNKLDTLKTRILAHTTELMDTYSVMKEEGKLYSKRDFEFMYRKVNGSWKYYDFVRGTDRPISEQKSEIQNLIEIEIDTLLLDFVNAQGIDGIEQLHIRFHSDGLNISDVRRMNV